MTPGAEVVGTTWGELLRKTSATVADPMEARWLLEEVSGLDGAGLLRALEAPVSPRAAARLESLLARRSAGEPLQHVLGHWGFRGLEVSLDARVLVPRPETEQVVTLALRELDRPRGEPTRAGLAADLGTGSGVIALSLVAERTLLRVVATDNDPAALAVARANGAGLAPEAATRVEFREGDWYQALPAELKGRFDLVVSNPPYLAAHEWAGLDPTVRDYDPYGALVAGASGLEALEAVVGGAPAWLGPRGSVVVEIAPHQAAAALELAAGAGFGSATVEQDLARRPRALVARR